MKRAYPTLLLASLLGTASCIFSKRIIFVEEPLSWDEARAHCRTKYIDLVSFKTTGIMTFISAVNEYLVAPSWIGLSKRPDESRFTRWSDGTQISSTFWQDGEPNYYYHCTAVLTTYKWKTFNCSKPLSSFCFKWEPQIILVKELMTWDEALRHCQKNYTELGRMTTAGDFIAVNDSLHNETSSVWIGLRFIDTMWFWVNGKPLVSLAVLPSCPAPSFQCGALDPSTDVLENRDCMEKRKFICF